MIISNRYRKRISLLLFGAAIIVATPPMLPEIFSDLFINLPMAKYISSKLGISLITSLVLTYTAVPILIIWIASFIYPAETNGVFNRFIKKLKQCFFRYIALVKQKPAYLMLILVVLLIFWKIILVYIERINLYILGG